MICSFVWHGSSSSLNNYNSRDVSLYFAISSKVRRRRHNCGVSINLYRLSSVLFNQCSILLGKCVCPLQIAYVYLASGGFAPRPPPGLCPWTPLGDFRPPDPLCPPYLQTLATPLHSTTGGHGERCKDTKWVQGRVPADNTFWVGASDPILSRLQCLRNFSEISEKFSLAANNLWTFICTFMQFTCVLVHFGSKLTINDGRKI